jgi:hypothetical protein
MLPTPNTLDMARRLPNNELVIYPDTGHGGIFQFHEQFVEKALEFLANYPEKAVGVHQSAGRSAGGSRRVD